MKDPKVDRSLMKLTACIDRFRDHFLEPHLGTFWQHVKGAFFKSPDDMPRYRTVAVTSLYEMGKDVEICEIHT